MSNKNNKFLKTPLSIIEKEKKAEDFLNFTDREKKEKFKETNTNEKKIIKENNLNKSVKRLTVRVPEKIANDLYELVGLTGYSLNSVCIEVMKPTLDSMLKDFRKNKK